MTLKKQNLKNLLFFAIASCSLAAYSQQIDKTKMCIYSNQMAFVNHEYNFAKADSFYTLAIPDLS